MWQIKLKYSCFIMFPYRYIYILYIYIFGFGDCNTDQTLKLDTELVGKNTVFGTAVCSALKG